MAIAVVRAETFYLPPWPAPASEWDGMPAAERVWLWADSRGVQHPPMPTDAVATQRYSRIEANRWIADCGGCASAQVVSPADPRYGCIECGYGWGGLIFPADVDAVEASLMPLKPSLRTWWNPDDPDDPNRPIDPVPSPGPMIQEK